MFQKLTKKILLSLCIALLFVQAPMATKAKTSEHTEAVQSTEVSKTQNASKTTTPVKYTWKGKKLSSSFFVYRSKLSTQDKKVYDELYTNLAAGKKKTTFKTKVSTSKIKKLVQYVIYDNPEFFWVECDFKYTHKNGKVISVTMTFNSTASNLKKNKQKFEKAVKPILQEASKAKTTIEKVKIVHDYLTRTISYNTSANLSQSAYSAIVNKSSVCAGYSKAFMYIMNQLGIRAAYVTGSASGEAHAWNLVYINKKWYNMDVTWDDPIGNPSNNYYYDYFNLSDKQISKDHKRDAIGKILPKCTSTKYNYDKCSDLFEDTVDTDDTDNSAVPSDLISSVQNETTTRSLDSSSYTQADLLTTYYNSPDSLSYWTYYDEYNMYIYSDSITNIGLIYEPITTTLFAITPDDKLYYLDWNNYSFLDAA